MLSAAARLEKRGSHILGLAVKDLDSRIKPRGQRRGHPNPAGRRYRRRHGAHERQRERRVAERESSFSKTTEKRPAAKLRKGARHSPPRSCKASRASQAMACGPERARSALSAGRLRISGHISGSHIRHRGTRPNLFGLERRHRSGSGPATPAVASPLSPMKVRKTGGEDHVRHPRSRRSDPGHTNTERPKNISSVETHRHPRFRDITELSRRSGGRPYPKIVSLVRFCFRSGAGPLSKPRRKQSRGQRPRSARP